MLPADKTIAEISRQWQMLWPEALSAWSRYTTLPAPLWCLTEKEQKKHGLTGSFAMIRLEKLQVVIGISQVSQLKLADFGLQIMAHEAGHHVYAPANLRDNARLSARIRNGLPGYETHAPFVANLYTDLLVNDRLQRYAELDMAAVYKVLKQDNESPVWQLYMRIYELLWSLPELTLTSTPVNEQIQGDSDLGARLIRAYATEWLDGAGSFACLLLPYIKDEHDNDKAMFAAVQPWLDTMNSGDSDVIPDGLTEVDSGELSPVHPSEDSKITGLSTDNGSDESENQSDSGNDELSPGYGAAEKGGRQNNYRRPADYIDLMQATGVKVKAKDLIIRYYRERAIPYIISFPKTESVSATDPLPEGLDVWDSSSPVSSIDWTESIIRSPLIIPGVTTVERTYGKTKGTSESMVPLDLYLGIDCSGSMVNPAYSVSYPVIAGTVMTLSALRAKAKVMACLSGETPGKYSQTDGFLNCEKDIMTILTGYLGTGYAFGIKRLSDTFLTGKNFDRKIHIVLLSDSDIFAMLDNTENGWTIAEDSAKEAGGGATACLTILNVQVWQEKIERLKSIGWNVYLVNSMEHVVEFARKFSKLKYENEKHLHGRRGK